jgi:hypothetical protein
LPRICCKILAIWTSIAAAISPADAQVADTTRPGGFFVHQFLVNEKVARWLVAYDMVAWVTSDLTVKLPAADQKRLGSEWFCFDQSGVWHAAYGRYDSSTDRFDLVAHYMETGGHVALSNAPVDSSMALEFARALHTAQTHPPSAVRKQIRYNQYIRRLPDSRIEIWLLPAWQPNGVMVYGADFRQTFDSSGHTLVDSAYRVEQLRFIRPDTSITLDMASEHSEVPGVGDLFFVYAYHKYFARIVIYTQDFLSTLPFDTTGKPIAWVHARRRRGTDSTAGKRSP